MATGNDAKQRNATAQTAKTAVIGPSIMAAIRLGWRGQGRMMKAMW